MAGADGPEHTALPADQPETEESGETASSRNGGESIFSLRSGIRDPLTRQESSPLPPEEASSEEEPVSSEPSSDEPQTEEKKEESGHSEHVNPAKGKGRKRLKRHPVSARARRREKASENISAEMEEQRRLLRQRRRQKKRRVLLHRLRLLLKLIFIGVWGVLLWMWCHSSMWTFDPPAFTLSQNRLLQARQLYPLVARWKGQPLYRIDSRELVQRIKSRFDIVDRVSIRRRMFPAQLDVLVLEKKPWAELYADETRTAPYALAVPGELISLAEYQYRPGVYKDNPPFRLVIAPRTRLRLGYLARLREIGWQTRHIQGLHLLNIDARDPRRIILNFEEVPVILGVLDNGASTRLARLLPLLPKIREFREGIASVDLQWEGQATFHRKPNIRMSPPEEEDSL